MCVMHILRTMKHQTDIKALRKKLKWSRSKLAKAAGVDVSTVCRWENSGVPSRGPAKAFLDRLAMDEVAA